MNSSHTDRLSAAMRGSRNFRQGGGGGGGVHVNLTKKNSDSVVCLFLFFAFFLVLGLFTEVKWLISKRNIIFQGSGGGPNFSRGGGELLTPYRNPNNL